MAALTIWNETKATLPSVAFRDMADEALPAGYKLNLIFTDEKRMHELNMQYRGKDKATDILSFPLEKDSGEIFISLEAARKEAQKFDREFDNFIAFLFIHGCVHLKGFDHGGKMERIEAQIRRKFGI